MGSYEPVVAQQHLDDFDRLWEASVEEREEPLPQV
jgi:hypothetical protein